MSDADLLTSCKYCQHEFRVPARLAGKQLNCPSCQRMIQIADAPAKAEDKQLYYHDIVTMAQPNGPDGQPVTSLVAVKVAVVPKGAPHLDVAKEFLKYIFSQEGQRDVLKDGYFPVTAETARQQLQAAGIEAAF